MTHEIVICVMPVNYTSACQGLSDWIRLELASVNVTHPSGPRGSIKGKSSLG